MIDPALTIILLATGTALAFSAKRVKQEGDQKARDFRQYFKENFQHKTRGR